VSDLTASLAAVSSRIAQIQGRIDSLTGAPAAASGASFADALAGATRTATATGAGASYGEAVLNGGSAVSGDGVVTDAARYLGVPYQWGGTNPSSGLDCSALVQRVYGDIGIALPRVAADQARQGAPVASLAEAQPGDLVAFGSPAEHIGIYIGNGKMIDAPHTGAAVRVDDVGQPTSIRRIIGAEPTTSVSPAVAQYQSLFAAAGAQYGVPANVLAAVAQVESGGDPGAVSPAGAEGLMQIMPATAQGIGVNPLDPAQAIGGAAQILSGDLKQFGSLPLALAAYNAGAGAVQQAGGIPPYAETQAYVQRVLSVAGGTA
jgi:cell wall-associated NlpC family hydrolase